MPAEVPAHIVGEGRLQHWRDRLLGRVPQALCGFDLTVPYGEPDPNVSETLVCGTCADLAGWTPGQYGSVRA